MNRDYCECEGDETCETCDEDDSERCTSSTEIQGRVWQCQKKCSPHDEHMVMVAPGEIVAWVADDLVDIEAAGVKRANHVRLVVAGAIARRVIRVWTESLVLALVPRHDRSQRRAVIAYVREKYEAAGAGANVFGTWFGDELGVDTLAQALDHEAARNRPAPHGFEL